MTIDSPEADWPSFKTLADVMTFAGLAGDPADKNTLAGSLCYLLGSDVGDHPRVLALIPEDDFSILLEKFPAMVAGSLVLQDPTPRQAGQGALVGRTCRVVVGLKFAPIGAAPPPLSSEQLTMLHALFQSGRLHPG